MEEVNQEPEQTEIAQLPLELKIRIQDAKTFNKNLITTEESNILHHLMYDKRSDLDDRILAAKTLWQISENMLYHIRNIAEKEKMKFLELEHEKQQERNLKHLVDDLKDINQDDLMKAIQLLMDKKGL